MNISYRSPGDALRVKDKPSSRGNTILKSIALVQEALGIHIISEQCNYPSSSWLNRFLQPFQNGRAQLHCDCSYRIVSFHAVRQWPPETDSDIAQDWPFVEVLDRPLALDAPASLSANQRHLPPPFLTPNPCDHNQTPNLLLTFSVFVCGVGSQDGNECGRMTNSLRYWSAHKQQTPDSGHLHTGGCNTNFTDSLHQDTFFTICYFFYLVLLSRSRIHLFYLLLSSTLPT